MKNIGEKIREVREKRNFTQDYMAQELDLTPNGYGKIERGDSKVTFDKLEKIAKVLKVKLGELVELDSAGVELNDNTIENIDKIAGIIICEVSEKERELYEKQIAQLKEENLYLRGLVDKLAIQK